MYPERKRVGNTLLNRGQKMGIWVFINCRYGRPWSVKYLFSENGKTGLVHANRFAHIGAPPHALRALLNASQKGAICTGMEMISIDYTIPVLLAPFAIDDDDKAISNSPYCSGHNCSPPFGDRTQVLKLRLVLYHWANGGKKWSTWLPMHLQPTISISGTSSICVAAPFLRGSNGPWTHVKSLQTPKFPSIWDGKFLSSTSWWEVKSAKWLINFNSIFKFCVFPQLSRRAEIGRAEIENLITCKII